MLVTPAQLTIMESINLYRNKVSILLYITFTQISKTGVPMTEQVEPCIFSGDEHAVDAQGRPAQAAAGQEIIRLAACADLMQITKGEFNPSMKTLCKILETLQHAPLGRTELAQMANMNYKRLSRCIALLQQKGLAELAIADGRIVVRLTQEGGMLAPFVSKLVTKTDTA